MTLDALVSSLGFERFGDSPSHSPEMDGTVGSSCCSMPPDGDSIGMDT
jgi:hypothetical protein